jgi:hypothetical protein
LGVHLFWVVVVVVVVCSSLSTTPAIDPASDSAHQMAFQEMNYELFYGDDQPPKPFNWIVNSSRRRNIMLPTYSSGGAAAYSSTTSHDVDPYSNKYSSSDDRHHVVRNNNIIPAVQAVTELMVPGMCCSKCEEKLREEIFELEGVDQVLCDPVTPHKVIVTGFVDPLRVLKKAKHVNSKSQFWAAAFASSSHQKRNNNRHEHRDYMLEYIPAEMAHHQSRYNRHDSEFFTTATGSSSQYEIYPSSSGSYFGSQSCNYHYYAPSAVHYSRSYPSSSRHDDDAAVITNPNYLKHIESEYYNY